MTYQKIVLEIDIKETRTLSRYAGQIQYDPKEISKLKKIEDCM